GIRDFHVTGVQTCALPISVTVDPADVSFQEMRAYVERTFRHMADNKNLEFAVSVEDDIPGYMTTDAKRLQQVLKNLLSNAFKFTDRGRVEMRVHLAKSGWSPSQNMLNRSRSVIAFSVSDTGIGIHPDKQQLIFEAFQQADGTTSRKYGGTGLGLSISREIARLLGGEIRLSSSPGEGSTFTLYLPLDFKALPMPGGKRLDEAAGLLLAPEIRRDDQVPQQTSVAERVPALQDAEVRVQGARPQAISD